MNIYLDLETIGTDDPVIIDLIAAKIKAPGNMKKADTIAKWEAEEKPAAVAEAVAKTSFDGTYGKIVCYSIAFDDEEPGRLCSDNEKDIIARLFAVIRQRAEGKTVKFIGHNIHSFDLRFLWQRAVINDLLPAACVPFHAKAWDEAIGDTMVMWNPDKDKRISLDNLCKVLKIDTPKGDMDGSKVWDAFRAGEYQRIADYCAGDVQAVRSVYKRLTFYRTA